MENNDEEMRKDENDQRERSTKMVKMYEKVHEVTKMDLGAENQDICQMHDDYEDPARVITHQENRVKDAMSYENMLLGINGMTYGYNSDENENWINEEDSKDEMQETIQDQMNPLCP